MLAEQLTPSTPRLITKFLILQSAQREAENFKIQIAGYDWRIQVLETSKSLGKNREAGLKAEIEGLQSAVAVGASLQHESKQENIRAKVGCPMVMLNIMILDRHAHSDGVTIYCLGHPHSM